MTLNTLTELSIGDVVEDLLAPKPCEAVVVETFPPTQSRYRVRILIPNDFSYDWDRRLRAPEEVKLVRQGEFSPQLDAIVEARQALQEARKAVKKAEATLYDAQLAFVEGKPISPPYEGTTQYRDEFDHAKFWEWTRRRSRTHSVYVSEYEAPSDFECVWQSDATSSLSANSAGGGSKKSIERLFTFKELL
jgi:hypothetical protein